MPSSDISRSDLVRAMIDIGTTLASPDPLVDRLTALCDMCVTLLKGDAVGIARHYASGYKIEFLSAANPTFTEHFSGYVIPHDRPIIQALEHSDSFLLLHDESTIPMTVQTRATGIGSLIIVPFNYPGGAPLGFLAVGYGETERPVSTTEAELASGMARMAQTALLRDVEVRRRREVSEAMLEVADSERRRLSRDIHDDPLQRILALRIGLEAFRENIDQNHQQQVDHFIEQCRVASATLREVMLSARPGASEMTDLKDVITHMLQRGERHQTINLDFIDDRPSNSPSYLVPTLNRIGEQAARNTLHHAQATQLTIRLSQQRNGTLLEITDNGTGFDPLTIDDSRLGIVSMRERTELLDGRFLINSQPGQGTTVSAWFPHLEHRHTPPTTDPTAADRTPAATARLDGSTIQA
jgi:signal transduction histidine kinase